MKADPFHAAGVFVRLDRPAVEDGFLQSAADAGRVKRRTARRKRAES